MKNFIKYLAIIITFSILFSSCSVYYKKEASFNEVYLSEKPVKLITKENRKIFLRKIILKDTTYHGVYKSDGKKITFPISKEKYRSVRIKNRTASTLLNVGGSLLTLGAFTAVLVASTLNDIDFSKEFQINEN